MAVTVRIGGNIGTEFMGPELWRDFYLAVDGLFLAAWLEFDEGIWDGVVEANCTVSGTIRTLTTLVEELGELAQLFGQDAIAVHVPEWDDKNWLLVDQGGNLAEGWPFGDDDEED